MSRAGTSYCVMGFGKIVNIIVAFVAAFWLLLKALFIMEYIYGLDLLLTVVFTALLIITSAKFREERNKMLPILMIPLGLVLQSILYFFVTPDFPYNLLASLDAFLIAIYIYWSANLGFNIAESRGIDESSLPINRIIPLILIFIGAVGLIVGLPRIVAGYFVPGSSDLLEIAPYYYPINGLLTSLIVIGASAMSLRPNSIYTVLFLIGFIIVLLPYFINVSSIPSYGTLWTIGDIMYKLFGVLLVTRTEISQT